MKQRLFSSSRLAALGVMVLGLTGVSAAPAAAATTSCTAPVLSQPFLSYGDSNWYTLTPGESQDHVNGSGWTLTGGAKLVSAGVSDGSTGTVLDLPPGSRATTPVMCVESGMPLARMITRMVGTTSSSNATSFQVFQAGGSTIGGAMPVNGTTSWALSAPVNVVPGSFIGWKQVYFTFTANSSRGDLQLYDLYVDPRCR